MVSQLRGRKKTVPIWAAKKSCESKRKGQVDLLTPYSPPQMSNTPPVVYCWKCKGSHAPSNGPNFNHSRKSKPSYHSHPQQHHPQPSYHSHPQQPHPQHSQSADEQKRPSVNTVAHTSQSASCITSHSLVRSLWKFSKPGGKCGTALPQQLTVPFTVRNLRGKAGVDTGSTYSLLSEHVWNSNRLAEWKHGVDWRNGSPNPQCTGHWFILAQNMCLEQVHPVCPLLWLI